MIKRSESQTSANETPSSSQQPGRRKKRPSRKRRLLMEGLEQRQLLNAGSILPPGPTTPVNTFDGARNIGSVTAFNISENEGSGEFGENDTIFTADLLPLGTAAGKQDTIDLIGSMAIDPFNNQPGAPVNFSTDIDVFAFDLRAGDILDIAAFGSVGTIDVTYGEGTSQFGSIWFATDTVLPTDGSQPTTPLANAAFYPDDSPLQTIGDVGVVQIVPEDGRYYLTLSPGSLSEDYTVGLRTYRPVSEQLPIGSQQIVFLDFDGAIYPRNVFSDLSGVPQTGIIRVPSLFESLTDLGVVDSPFTTIAEMRAIENLLIDKVLLHVESQFASIATNGGNGDYDSTGIAGQYGLTVLNSRDHSDPASSPGLNQITTRVVVGGNNADVEQGGLLGISSTIDIGNFSMDDIVLAVLDQVQAYATQFPLATTISVMDSVAKQIAITITHEAAHSFGSLHTNGDSFQPSLIDGTGANTALFDLGPGPDGIVGNFDDTPIDFPFMDEFDLNEGLLGFNRVADALAFTLATGTVGTATTGLVFNDANRNGSSTGDSGIGGVTVFADINSNGTRDAGEPATTTAANGTFSLGAPAGSYNIIATPPANFGASTPTAIAANSGSLNFGFFRTTADATGTVKDTNGNPIEGVYVYIDLDGDKRPDLGEPAVSTAADGSYSLNFADPGTYTICVVVPAGFRQVTPTAGTGVSVNFDGTQILDPITGLPIDALFEFEASSDFGDAPLSYGSASHGIIDGLSLGVGLPDSENASQPNATATGDDITGIDDENAVFLTGPLGPGGTTTVSVGVTNTTSSTAYLQGFIDFNGDGDFADAGEQVAVNLPIFAGLGVQSISVPVSVPALANIGGTFARFRLSQTIGIGATGFASSGEVEDYAFSILPTTGLANDDPDSADPTAMTVSRNSNANVLDVLANDFDIPENPLTITNINRQGISGQIDIQAGSKAILYSPPNGFVGSETFSYTVSDSFGNTSTADVTVTVRFQSENPIAVDDSFEVPAGSSNRALNVLANDVPSIAGGISVISVTGGSAGGFLSVTGGGQSIRYTPPTGFTGTEQFTYTIQDSQGNISSAIGTVHLLPGALQDDIVQFSLDLLDVDGQLLNGGIDNITPSVRVGDTFQVRVSVDDLRTVSFATPEGVASASLDLLYSAALVAVGDAIPGLNGGFDFDISFGQIFGGLSAGDADTPGILNDVGAIQTALDPQSQVQHTGPTELFTVTMQAVAPGVAQFIGDPSENQQIETAVIAADQGLTPGELGFERTELLILPRSSNFTSAVEDSFPNGIDSNGNPISSGTVTPAILNVLGNDNLRIVNGQPTSITQFGLVTSPSLGSAAINNNGTPDNFNDDFISYRAEQGANGLEQFSYFIVDAEGSSSVANVTIALGNHNATAEVEMDFQLVREDGTLIGPTDTVTVGDRVGVQIFLEDLKVFSDYVFAGYLDVLYSNGVLSPSTDLDASVCDASHNGSLATELNFSACIGDDFAENATSGSAVRPGVINEFGSNFNRVDAVTGPNPALLATIFFDAVAPGTGQVTGSPADRLPESDTVIFGDDDPVDVSKIRYDSVSVQVVGSTLQNASFPQDVDADGEATALDALIIVNRLGDLINGENPLDSSGGFYIDVNGDFKVTAIDALQVINYISRTNGGGEAEASAPVAPTSTVNSPASSQVNDTDAAFAALATNGASKIVASDVGGGQLAPAASIIMDDDDDDDGLDLFADDIFGQWN